MRAGRFSLILFFLVTNAFAGAVDEFQDSPYIDYSHLTLKPGTYVGFSKFQTSKFKIPTILTLVKGPGREVGKSHGLFEVLDGRI